MPRDETGWSYMDEALQAGPEGQREIDALTAQFAGKKSWSPDELRAYQIASRLYDPRVEKHPLSGEKLKTARYLQKFAPPDVRASLEAALSAENAKPPAQQTAESAATLQSGLDQINTGTRSPEEAAAKKQLEAMRATPPPSPPPGTLQGMVKDLLPKPPQPAAPGGGMQDQLLKAWRRVTGGANEQGAQ